MSDEKPKPLTSEEMRKRIQKALAEDRVEIAPSEAIDRHQETVDRILRIMGDLNEMDWNWENCIVTDESSVGHFLREDAQLLTMSVEMGFTVKRGDRLLDVAMRLEPKQ